MTTHDSFLQSILNDPADTGARLVYADWLEENGQGERAEFIRVQCQLVLEFGVPVDGGPVVTGDKQADALETRLRQREGRLLAEHWHEWAFPRATCCDNFGHDEPLGVLFRRGFVEVVRCRLADWMSEKCRWCKGSGDYEGPHGKRRKPCGDCHGTGRIGGHGPAIVRCQPVTRVVIADRRPYLNSGGDWVWLSDKIHNPEETALIPHSLFALLVGGNLSVLLSARYYSTEAAALDALSAASILWAKS